MAEKIQEQAQFQTQLLQMEKPYQIIYCGGLVARHIATLISSKDISQNSKARMVSTFSLAMQIKSDVQPEMSCTPETFTSSHPVVDYWGAPGRVHNFLEISTLYGRAPVGGVVWNLAKVSDCIPVCLETDKSVSWPVFEQLVEFGRSKMKSNKSLNNRMPEGCEDMELTILPLRKLEAQFKRLGINVKKPKPENSVFRVDVVLTSINPDQDSENYFDFYGMDVPLPFATPYTDAERASADILNQVQQLKSFLGQSIHFSFEVQGSIYRSISSDIYNLTDKLNKSIDSE